MLKKTWTKIAAFVVLVSVVQVAAFHHYNSILGQANSLTNQSGDSNLLASNQQIRAEVEKLKAKYPVVDVSPNGQYVAYADTSNIVHVMDLTTDKQLMQYNEGNLVTYLLWIRNDTLFVGLQQSPGVITLNTLDILEPNSPNRLIHTFYVSPTASIRKISYSYLTNDTYILIATDSSSVLYHYDTNGNINRVHLGGVFVKNVAVTLTGDILYYEDYSNGTFNVMSDNNGTIQTIQQGGALIDVVNNTLYYGVINNQGLVTAVYKLVNGQGVLVSTLAQPELAEKISVNSNGQITIHHRLPSNILQPSSNTSTDAASAGG